MFALPWLVWGSAIAQANGLISWRLPQGIALWVLTPSIVLAALLIGGAPAQRDLGSRLIRWRVPCGCTCSRRRSPSSSRPSSWASRR